MDRMTSLEKRLEELLSLMKRLKDDRAKLKKEVQNLEKELSKKDREANRWLQDRKRLRTRVEQILSETGSLLQAPRAVPGDNVKPRRRAWEAEKGGDA